MTQPQYPPLVPAPGVVENLVDQVESPGSPDSPASPGSPGSPSSPGTPDEPDLYEPTIIEVPPSGTPAETDNT